MLEIKHDAAADAIYITLDSDQYAYGHDLDDQRRIDYADNGHPIGIELLSVSRGVNLSDLPYSDIITSLLCHSGIKTYEIIPSYVYSGIGTTNVSLDIMLGNKTRLDYNKIEVKKELTGVS
jgi:uncharacterized protein YuzE